MGDNQPLRSGTVEADGHRLFWEYHGSGDRDVVCLLNGLAMHAGAWYRFLPLLTTDVDVLLYDYPGQGQSSCEDVPYFIPRIAAYLADITDELAIEKLHIMGISYGGFVALDYARQFQERLHTMTISGILLTHEELFRMYQELSLRFYRSGPEVFEIYTHYMYEKIFGETFVRKMKDKLDDMRKKFHDLYRDKTHALIRLTEAQNPFFDSLDENLAGYQAIQTPTLIMAGEEDRTIPTWVQSKVAGILPVSRFDIVADSGHVVYIEKPDLFFGNLKKFMQTKSLNFQSV